MTWLSPSDRSSQVLSLLLCDKAERAALSEVGEEEDTGASESLQQGHAELELKQLSKAQQKQQRKRQQQMSAEEQEEEREAAALVVSSCFCFN